MIVCICKNINTRQIAETVESGAHSVDEVRRKTGAASCCGKCQFKVNSIVNDKLTEMDQAAFYDASASA